MKALVTNIVRVNAAIYDSPNEKLPAVDVDVTDWGVVEKVEDTFYHIKFETGVALVEESDIIEAIPTDGQPSIEVTAFESDTAKYIFEQDDAGTFKILGDDQVIATGEWGGAGVSSMTVVQPNVLGNMIAEMFDLLEINDVATKTIINKSKT